MKPFLQCSVLIVILFSSGCVALPERGELERQQALDLIDRGVLQLENGYTEQAYAIFEMAFEHYPLPEALDGLGCVEVYRGNILKAKNFFELALKFDESYYRAISHLALIAELEGRVKEAEALYKEYLLLEPGNFRTRNNYAAFLVDTAHDSNRPNLQKMDRARQELLRANGIHGHEMINSNFKKIEMKYGR